MVRGNLLSQGGLLQCLDLIAWLGYFQLDPQYLNCFQAQIFIETVCERPFMWLDLIRWLGLHFSPDPFLWLMFWSKVGVLSSWRPEIELSTHIHHWRIETKFCVCTFEFSPIRFSKDTMTSIFHSAFASTISEVGRECSGMGCPWAPDPHSPECGGDGRGFSWSSLAKSWHPFLCVRWYRDVGKHRGSVSLLP